MPSTLVIRPAQPDDERLVRDLAELDSAAPLRGEVLLAVVDDRPVAAISMADDRVVADPFTLTADAVALLRERVKGLRHTASGARTQRRSVRRRLGLAA
jgi:hypothetical protein